MERYDERQEPWAARTRPKTSRGLEGGWGRVEPRQRLTNMNVIYKEVSIRKSL